MPDMPCGAMPFGYCALRFWMDMAAMSAGE